MYQRYPYTKGPDGKNVCRHCHGKVPRPRIYWCSDKCVEAAYLRCDPATQRRKVEERDEGVCAICRLDTASIHAAFAAVVGDIRKRDPGSNGWSHWVSSGGQQAIADAQRRFMDLGIKGGHGHLWEMDHIVPIIEGGDEIEDVLGNLRTLCVPCHKQETKALAARRARARRIAAPAAPVDDGGRGA